MVRAESQTHHDNVVDKFANVTLESEMPYKLVAIMARDWVNACQIKDLH